MSDSHADTILLAHCVIENEKIDPRDVMERELPSSDEIALAKAVVALVAELAEARREAKKQDGLHRHYERLADIWQGRGEAAEARVEQLEQALRLAYPYMKDALEEGGMTDPVEAIIRADIEHVASVLRSFRSEPEPLCACGHPHEMESGCTVCSCDLWTRPK